MLNYCIQRRQKRNAEDIAKECLNKQDSNENSSLANTQSSVSYKDFQKPSSSKENNDIAQSSDLSGQSRDTSWSQLLANINKNDIEEKNEKIFRI